MTTDDLSRELAQARDSLRRVKPPTGARQRILLHVLAQSRRPASGKTLRFCLAASLAAVTISGSAIGFNLVLPRILDRLGQVLGPVATIADHPEEASASPRDRGRPRLLPSSPQSSPSRSAEPWSPEESNLGGGDQNAVAVATRSARPDESARGGLPVAREAPARAEARIQAKSEAAQSELSQPATSPSQLSQQLEAYQQAVAAIVPHPDRALEQLQAMRRRWPASALSHEVDLRIVQALLALQRRPEARAEARAFLVNHPGSAHQAEMEVIASP